MPFAKFNASESLWNPLAKDFRLLEADHVEQFLAPLSAFVAFEHVLHFLLLEILLGITSRILNFKYGNLCYNPI